MNKRFKYFISALISALGFYLFVSLPFESRYFGLMVGMVLAVFCFWFGLGIIFEKSLYTRMMAIILPICFFVGLGLFVAFLPYNTVLALLFSLLFGIIIYALFLVENVFLVAIGFKTVPLYRAAYTVGLIIMLLTSFLMFNSLFSFRFNFLINGLGVGLISGVMFLYHFWSTAIELPDDGKDKSMFSYVAIPSILMSELAIVFSFWPTGIFKGSVYLVSALYVVSGLIQAEIRGRLFRRVWLTSMWIGVGIVLAMVVTTNWN